MKNRKLKRAFAVSGFLAIEFLAFTGFSWFLSKHGVCTEIIAPLNFLIGITLSPALLWIIDKYGDPNLRW